MKIKYLFKIFFSSVLLTTPVLFTTSCSKESYHPIGGKQFEYIDQHELSIAAISVYKDWSAYASFGTAWFYKRYSNNDYTYELITNYHVYKGIQDVLNDGESYEKILAFSNMPYSNTEVTKLDFRQHYIWNEESTTTSFSTIINKAFIYNSQVFPNQYMDICALKVDLSNAYKSAKEHKGDKICSTFVNKIDNINNLYQKGQTIVTINESELTPNTKVYMAGYPWATSDPKSDQDYTYFCEETDVLSELEKNSKNNVDRSYSTVQDQWTTNWKSLTYMGGGASGSMVVNENCEVVGIYWGGSGYENKSDFQKTFALFSIPSSLSSYSTCSNFFEYANSVLD